MARVAHLITETALGHDVDAARFRAHPLKDYFSLSGRSDLNPLDLIIHKTEYLLHQYEEGLGV